MEVLTFGRKNHLMGILHRAQTASVGVIMWNTGVSNRTGSFRSNVETAEVLVRVGYTVFRFDLSKLGDSVDPGENHSWQERNSLDIRDALDAVTLQTGITDFVLVGLCSGALDSYYFALTDTRVRGAFMIDGLTYPTRKHRFTFFATRLRSPYRWGRLLKKFLRNFIDIPEEYLPQDVFESNYPTAEEAAKGFQTLIERGIQLHMIYTGGFTPYYSYRRQFFDMLPGLKSKGRVYIEYWPDVDHLFMLREDRQRFISKLSKWLEVYYPIRAIPLADAHPMLLSAPTALPPRRFQSPRSIASRNGMSSFTGLQQAPLLPPTQESEALPEALTQVNEASSKGSETTLQASPQGRETIFQSSPQAPDGPQKALPQDNRALLKSSPRETIQIVLKAMNKVLSPSVLEADDNFFDFGGTSIIAVRAAAEISHSLQLDIPVVALYTYLKAQDIAKAIDAGEYTAATPSSPVTPIAPPELDAIAIIGMACKVPGADTIAEFWDMILKGAEGLSHWTLEELDASLPASMTRSAHYVPSRGVIEGDRFDAPFFKISKREAGLLDPQQRILLETSWQALEDSGYLAARTELKIAVYAGVGNNTYLTRNLAQGHFEPHSEEEYLAFLLNDKDYVATRIAHAMNLRGPAISVHTACSTSLVAVIEAIKALQAGQADIALAGAAAVNAPIASGHLYQEGGIYSRDGHCRPFDAKASGTVFSDGSAVVVLKPLKKALTDQDQIYAVIKGWGINNDGSDKSSFAAPSVKGQADAIRQALNGSGVDPATVGFIETHGTGTPIGDPIELEALKHGYGSLNPETCAIGSTKANIGHLTAAAGTISLIKAALAVQNAIKPMLANFTEPHPNIQVARLPFQFPLRNEPWQGLRRAGVSSFGVGGTNAHVVIEEAPLRQIRKRPWSQDPFVTLRWSTASLDGNRRFATKLRSPDDIQNLSYTLAHKRPQYPFMQAITGLGSLDFTKAGPPKSSVPKTKLIFCFPGQGSQYPKMGLELSQNWPRFAQYYKMAIEHFKEECNLDLNIALRDEILLNQTQYTQTNLFAMEWALGTSLREAGFEPSAALGHSLGEITAATLAGVFRFEDAAHLVFHRARLMQNSAPGLMLAVRAPLTTLGPLLAPLADLAAENGPENLVASGSVAAIESLETILKARDIVHKRLTTAHAFHSRAMDGVLDEFAGFLAKVTLNPPKISLYSTVTGLRMTVAEATSRAYWVEQIRKSVLFDKAIRSASELGNVSFIEIGPKDTLTKFIQQSSKASALSALPHRGLTEIEELGQLFSELSYQDHAPFIAKEGLIVNAPPYPFRGERYWLEPKGLRSTIMSRPTSPTIRETNMNSSRVKDLLGLLLDQAPEAIDSKSTWSDLGMDSLLLTQWALKLKREFGFDINLRRLQTDITSLFALEQGFGSGGSGAESDSHSVESPWVEAPPISANPPIGDLHRLMRDQIRIMNRQLDLMQKMMEGGMENPSEMKRSPVQPESLPMPPVIKRRFEFRNDRGLQTVEAPENAFIGLDDKGQPALFIEDQNAPNLFLEIS